ncbi:hypothetical protein Vi05172_g13585 [Venturia inaequalis]|nr:hypothetical protein Vi05172_g13585 [Venturia inaequalis]
MCYFEYYVRSNCAYKQHHCRPRPISNARLGQRFRNSINEPGWVPCAAVSRWPTPAMPVTVCRQNHGGGWPVHEIPDPEGPTNCQVCNRTGEEGGHYVTIQAGAIITARPIPDRVHQSDNRYAGGPGMCRPCTEAANYRAPPPPPFRPVELSTEASGPPKGSPSSWKP